MIDNAPLFSVIIPTYNRAALLRETLNSVREQEFRNFEVIVVDDGSTDDTGDLLAEFNNDFRICFQTNRGPGAARNLALQYARGRYVAFLDSDDLWFSWTLATYAKVIERYDSPSFITGCVKRFKHPDTPKEANPSSLTVEAFGDYLASGDQWRWYGLSSFVVDRKLIVAVGAFCDESINGEDADLSLRLGTAPGFVHVTSPYTFAYREHDGGVRHQSSKSVAGALHLLRREQSGEFPGGLNRATERWRILGRHLRPCSLGCVREGLISESWHLYKSTFRWNFALQRWRYLIAFPAILAVQAVRQKVKAAIRSHKDAW